MLEDYKDGLFFKVTFTNGAQLAYPNNVNRIRTYKADNAMSVIKIFDDSVELFVPDMSKVLYIEYNLTDSEVTAK